MNYPVIILLTLTLSPLAILGFMLMVKRYPKSNVRDHRIVFGGRRTINHCEKKSTPLIQADWSDN